MPPYLPKEKVKIMGIWTPSFPFPSHENEERVEKKKRTQDFIRNVALS